jgi:hypothetical protein
MVKWLTTEVPAIAQQAILASPFCKMLSITIE